MTAKPRIVIATGYFPPAYRAGGVSKTIANLVEALSDEFAFEVHCAHSDLGGIILDVPPRVQRPGGADVHYHSFKAMGWREVSRWSHGADLLYLTSFFSPLFSIKVAAARKIWGARTTPMLIAPHGELAAEVLELKSLKKRVGITGLRLTGLYSGAAWHASTSLEARQIAEALPRLGGQSGPIFVAADIAASDRVYVDPAFRKEPRIVFFGRISPVKNLDFALRVLRDVKAPTSLDIIGPIDSEEHWAQCRALIADLPPHHRVSYLGPITPDRVAATLAEYDLYLLPTRTENFGHSIQEALAAGLPALISDNTPWRDLQKQGAGWDLPLSEPLFVEAIESFAALSQPKRLAMRAAARSVAVTYGAESSIEENRQMFRAMIGAPNNARYYGGGRLSEAGASPSTAAESAAQG